MLRPSSASGQSQEKRDQNPYKLPTGIKKVYGTQKVEWEKLYEESLQLKSFANSLKDENIRLRTKNVNLEKDLQKCTRIIEEMEQTGNMKRFYQKPSTDNQMILNLKSQVKQLSEELNEAHAELQNIKKSSKYTKLTELEIECKNFQDETIRLSKFIEQIIQENIYQQQFENEQVKMKDMLAQRDELIKQMQEELEYYMNENKTLSEKLQQMVQAYQELDKMYSKYQNEAKNKIKIKDKQISELKNDIERTSVSSKQTAKQITLKKPKPQQYMDKPSVTKRDQSFKITNNTSMNRQVIDLIEEPVLIDDLKDICLELRLRLSAAQVKVVKLDNYLFATQIIDYGQLHDKLTKQPFLLDKPDAMLLARYLIEKHNQSYPYNSNINLSQSTQIVKAQFVRLVGFWPIYDKVEEKVIEINLYQLFDGVINNVEQKLSGQMMNYKKLLEALDSVLKLKEVSMKQIEYQFILSKIIKECQNIQKLNGLLVIKYIKELSETIDPKEQVSFDELQKYYSNKRNYFFLKQLRLKQEQLLALFDQEQQPEIIREEGEQKSAQVYIVNNGLVRSHSEPDLYSLKQMQEEEEEQMYQEEYEQQIKAFQQKFEDEDEEQEDNQQLDGNLNNITGGNTESEQYNLKKKSSQSEKYQEDEFENEEYGD